MLYYFCDILVLKSLWNWTDLFAFVVLGLVSSVLDQEIGWEERLRNDLLCVDWEVNR